jgi:hypothetical protein
MGMAGSWGKRIKEATASGPLTERPKSHLPDEKKTSFNNYL